MEDPTNVFNDWKPVTEKIESVFKGVLQKDKKQWIKLQQVTYWGKKTISHQNMEQVTKKVWEISILKIFRTWQDVEQHALILNSNLGKKEFKPEDFQKSLMIEIIELFYNSWVS